MKTVDEYTEEMYASGREIYALALIRCLDYDRTLDAEAYREQVHRIFSAVERARERRLADQRAELDRFTAELERDEVWPDADGPSEDAIGESAPLAGDVPGEVYDRDEPALEVGAPPPSVPGFAVGAGPCRRRTDFPFDDLPPATVVIQ